MPLRKSAGDTTVDWRGSQVLVATGLAADEAVEETILESGEKRGSEATAGETGMGRSFS